MDKNERKKQIKAVAAALIREDPEIARLKSATQDSTEKGRLFGRNLVLLSFLTAILGLYLHDVGWQAIFLIFTLTLAATGFWQTENPTKRPFHSWWTIIRKWKQKE